MATPVTPIILHGIINHMAKHVKVIIIHEKPKIRSVLDINRFKPNSNDDIGYRRKKITEK